MIIIITNNNNKNNRYIETLKRDIRYENASREKDKQKKGIKDKKKKKNQR